MFIPKKKNKETPLMRQYNQIKAQYPGTLLLCRVGDFYEAFGEDAVTLSKELNIVLTKRSSGSASAVELAGFPHHALDNYMPKLIKAGLRVAVCDQLEDPKGVKGLVKRGVTELVTPALSYYDSLLPKKQNNYLASLHLGKQLLGISFLDISTGEFFVTQGTQPYIEKLIQGLAPAEIIFNKAARKHFLHLEEHYHCRTLDPWVYYFDYAYTKLNEHFGTTNLKGFGIAQFPEGIVAAGAILRYLQENEQNHLKHINAISRLEENKYMWLDKFTIRNLELVQPQQEEGIPLIDILDYTVTPMGARKLRNWLLFPLKEKKAIEKRQLLVKQFTEQPTFAENLVTHLRQIGDLARLISKVAANRMPPRGFLALKKALAHTLPIQQLLQQQHNPALLSLSTQIHPCEHLLEKIHTTLQDNLPLTSQQANLIRTGVDAELDELRGLTQDSQTALADIQKKERVATGISSLKISFNRVFGYYLEVRNSHKDKVPANWIRKQTLVGAERYITQELKNYEEKILQAQEKMIQIEKRIYEDLLAETETFVPQIQQNSKIFAELDCYHSFATLVFKHYYVQPTLTEKPIISLTASRHPVIAHTLPPDQSYVPNDVFLDSNTQQILLITGPNMAGKSALLRQVALIVLMAQIGAPVPAEKAIIGLVDKIFSRVGASDNLAGGESTFMVEMNEMASIIHNLSTQSLIIVDELGRGTGTADGLALAQSTLEYLHNQKKCRARVLFATHYHELNGLSKRLKRLKNFNIAVKEVGDKIIFTHKLQPGGTSHSFGIQVAKMAGMPEPVIERAKQLLHHLTQDSAHADLQQKLNHIPPPVPKQMLPDDNNNLVSKIKLFLDGVDINTLAPVEALLKLEEIKRKFGKTV